MPKGDRISRTKAIILDTAAIAATDKYFGQAQSLSIAGSTMTPAEVKAVFQTELDALRTVDATRALLKEQVRWASKAGKNRHELRQALRAYILGTSGPRAVQMLLDFKLAVPKPKGPKKVEAKAKGVQAARATRAARHTMGKRQKQAIKATSSTSETKKP